MTDCERPSGVGIIAIDIYFPAQYVDQLDLEKFDGVDEGKYTIGLGQKRMGIATDREDIHALCLTVVNNLMDKAGIAWKDIGRLEVGTETIIDKSKSIKTVLLQLWDKYDPNGERDMEGIDTINACYGGTSALFNAVNWIESSAWDGRYALVVMGDIAIYGPGNGRPTSGAGAVAMIIGPDAPFALERGTRSTYAENAYDFYKPELHREYPYIDGHLSVSCYLKALDRCYSLFCSKSEKRVSDVQRHSLKSMDYMLFHCPYVKLVQKSLARLGYLDFTRADSSNEHPDLESFRGLKTEESYGNRDLDKVIGSIFKSDYKCKTESSTLVSSHVGNMYTASLYACLCSLILHQKSSDLAGKRLGMFSYGSGLVASMFALRATENVAAIEKMAKILSHVPRRLETRIQRSAEFFHEALDYRDKTAHQGSFIPKASLEELSPGTWYLVSVDEKHRRKYERRV
ncbi:unnamed protein product [Notodromas monacha]|uniref:Hydroxymethylglutaryl-CoA synthase n=1 Tax=Notodromas monacha TaxID=399045 RepID=A0A7R9GCX5_9CRUS|nr:unnamed protein product [Notodromas monacha]CAG0917932.1 unnamed protein product [Notodromas monacha]